jgi:hypothetical protein
MFWKELIIKRIHGWVHLRPYFFENVKELTFQAQVNIYNIGVDNQNIIIENSVIN